jgi:hypothetical protein
MNCKTAQERIAEALAAGNVSFPAEVAAHHEACAACRHFFQCEQYLFASMNSGLQVIANQPVPPSLLPGVRERIESRVPSRHAWPLVLWPAAGAVIACALLLPSLRNVQPSRETPVAEREQEAPSREQAPQSRFAVSHEPARSSVRAAGRKRSAPESFQTAAAEVMIDRSESRGLVLAARVAFQETEVAERLAPEHDSPPLVIEPVAIPRLEIRPLTEENR